MTKGAAHGALLLPPFYTLTTTKYRGIQTI